MKTERWFLFVVVLLVVLVAVFVIVTRLPDRAGTGNVVGFTCPDGSVVDSEDDCAGHVNIFGGVSIEPSSLDVGVGVGDDATGTFVVRNNNDFAIDINCRLNEQPWLEPDVSCVTYNSENKPVSSLDTLRIEAGGAAEYDVRVYTHEDSLLIQNGSKFTFTTHEGNYYREIILTAEKSGGSSGEVRIPLQINVVQ